ncbi:hypothetical protein AX15_002223 [Amanita polypyramis BW_CC]|nr:hypothetical protein AX15_002223 [Amanita polypyramis BW_CC]
MANTNLLDDYNGPTTGYTPNDAHYLRTSVAELKKRLRPLREQKQRMFRDLAHNFPADILRYIFILAAQDFGFTHLPFEKSKVALDTYELWNDVSFMASAQQLTNSVYMQDMFWDWLSRARKSPVSLSFRDCYRTNFVNLFRGAIKPFRVKKLELKLHYVDIFTPSQVDDLLPTELDEFSLVLNGNNVKSSRSTSDVPRLISKTHSLTFKCGHQDADHIMKSIPLPWSQLRCLNILVSYNPLSMWMGIPRQTPLLEELHITICDNDVAENQKLILPHLRKFYLEG